MEDGGGKKVWVSFFYKHQNEESPISFFFSEHVIWNNLSRNQEKKELMILNPNSEPEENEW